MHSDNFAISDGFAVNIRDCNAQSSQYVDALVEQKKDHAAAMKPDLIIFTETTKWLKEYQ